MGARVSQLERRRAPGGTTICRARRRAAGGAACAVSCASCCVCVLVFVCLCFRVVSRDRRELNMRLHSEMNRALINKRARKFNFLSARASCFSHFQGLQIEILNQTRSKKHNYEIKSRERLIAENNEIN